MTLQRVAIIGAGAAGLCVARHILSRPNVFAPPVLFELSRNIGGTWCYEEHTSALDNGRPVLSSMYRNLKTNLPKEVMMYPDFPFDPELSSFLPHQDVLRYLEKYCHSHSIQPHIWFNTEVEDVKPVVMTTDGNKKKMWWEVTSSGASSGQTLERFDAVFVCSGHYSDPHIPDIPGMDYFKGQVLHSHSYKYPEPFSGQSVVVLGAKASGLDISIELAKVGAQVTLSHGLPRLTFPLPSGIRQSSPIMAVEEDGRIRFQDDSVSEADVLLFCTGYNFRFPFLNAADLGIQIHDHLVTPLYRFMMPPAFPSLFFIGVCKTICPFPYFHCQAQFALSVLDGSVSLPSRCQMENEVKRGHQEKLDQGVQERHLLMVQKDQWEYMDTLALTAGFKPLPPVIRSLYEEVWRQRQEHSQNYRKHNYRMISDTQWELIHT